MEFEIPTPILEWLSYHVPLGILAFLVGIAVATFIGFLISAVRHGPTEAFYSTAKVLFTGVAELFQVSPRRVLAMARLSFKEAIRRKVLIVFAVFILIVLFAGWFLDANSTRPGRLYMSFVLTLSNFLALGLALFLSAFSLPADIKNRTIYTIMTKPVRAWEIIMGRILGFSAIGAVLLVVMGVFSYVFVVRGLSHSHTVDPADVHASADLAGFLEGTTSEEKGHSHRFTLDESGIGQTDERQGHWHQITKVGEGDAVKYTVGPPMGALAARVPKYGKIRFLDRAGKPGAPISVGYEWTYRGYFAGGTLAAAIWSFEGITPEAFPQGLPIEWNVSVFRTHKGDIETGVSGSWVLRNPDPAKANESPPISFESKEFTSDSMLIKRELEVTPGEIVDIFDEYVDDQGRIELLLRCEDRGQYFGAARADLYLLTGDMPLAWNFAKGYLSIGLQMLLVIGMGVMFSTVLSAPVAMLATLGSVGMGFFTTQVKALAESVFTQDNPEIPGGGPIEALIRLLRQSNLTLDLDMGFATTVIKTIDQVIMSVMWACASLLPNFARFDTVNFVAEGYNIPLDIWGQQLVIGLAYAAVATCLGYFLLRTREIAA